MALSLSLSIVISLSLSLLFLFLFLNSSSIVNFIFFATAISSGTNTWFSCRFPLCLFTFNFSFVDFRRRRHHTHSYFSCRHFAISLDRSTHHTLHMLHSSIHIRTLTSVHPYTNIHLIRLNAVLFFNLTPNLIPSRHNSIVLNNLHFVFCLRYFTGKFSVFFSVFFSSLLQLHCCYHTIICIIFKMEFFFFYIYAI